MQLDRMTDAQNAYNLAQKKTSLEIMRIRRKAMDRRGRLTRHEKQQIEELEKRNMDYRIAQMQGDIELEEFKEKHYDKAKEQYDKWVARQQHMIHDLQDIRNEELENALHNLNLMIQSRETYLSDLKIVFNKEEDLYREHYASLKSLRNAYISAGVPIPEEVETGISKLESKIKTTGGLTYAEALTKYYAEHPGVMGPIKPSDLIKYGYRGYQTGTPYVPETGLYVLHRGEAVIPAGRNMASKIHVEPITVNVTINDNADVEHLVQKIELAVQSGLISGIETTYK